MIFGAAYGSWLGVGVVGYIQDLWGSGSCSLRGVACGVPP